jgi:hypothetical protein
VVLSGNGIVAAEERPSYASNDAVIEADAVIGGTEHGIEASFEQIETAR